MVKYKVSYFAIKALGEPVRYMLAYTGEEFEDNRIPRAEWPKHKPTFPFGKVPVLEVDGKQAHQSKAICRYLAKKSNVVGSNDWEDLQIDGAVETVDDIRGELVSYFHEGDPDKKAAKQKVLLDTTVPFYLSRFEALVKENGGYLVGGKLTWADIYFASQMKNVIDALQSGLFEKYPALVQLHEKVHAIPNIANYLAKRPPYETI